MRLAEERARRIASILFGGNPSPQQIVVDRMRWKAVRDALESIGGIVDLYRKSMLPADQALDQIKTVARAALMEMQ